MKKILVVYLFILFCSDIFSLDTAAVKYFPLQTGNKWIYVYTEHPSGFSHIMHWDVTGQTFINGHNYFIIDEYYTDIHFNNFIRYDSLNSCLRKYSTTGCPWLINETNMDSLSSALNDSSTYDCDIRYRCNDTNTISVFNTVYKKKGFYAIYDFGYRIRTFARSIGLVNTFSAGVHGTYSTVLKGCVLNGVVYGDTSSLVPIVTLQNNSPGKFMLLQNYPNPFNPVTHFGFHIAESGSVRLTIFDAIGRIVEVLVNKEFQPGFFEAEWNAEAYPTGIYYYQLEVITKRGDFFNKTKKMALVK